MIINSTYRPIKGDLQVNFKSPVVAEAGMVLSYFQKLFDESSYFLSYSSKHYASKNVASQESFIKTFSEDEHSFAIFAYINNAVVGHIIIHNLGSERTQHRATLMMGVLEEWQNKGIGKILLTIGIEEALKLDILSLELCVRELNTKAIKLYIEHGFTKIGMIQGAAKIDGVFFNEYLFVRNSQSLINQLTPVADSDFTNDDYKKKIAILEDKIASLEMELAGLKKDSPSSHRKFLR